MERRLLVAFALSFLVIMLSRALWEPAKPPILPVRPAATKDLGKAEKNAAPESSLGTVSPTAVIENKQAANETSIQVETDLYRFRISNKGAVIRSWVLKKYKDSSQKPLDLLARKEEGAELPLAVRVEREEETTSTLASALFQCDAPQKLEVLSGNQSSSLTFEFSNGNVRALKKLVIAPGSYKIGVESKVWIGGKPRDHFLLWPSGFGDAAVDERTALHHALYRSDQKITRLKGDKIESEQEISGAFDFAGLEDQYFAVLFLPDTSQPIKRILLSRQEHVKENGKKELLPAAGVLVSQTGAATLNLFVGPKDTSILPGISPSLSAVIDYGWFGIVARPLFMALKGIYAYVRNYGLSIILLTILINIALFPLRYKSMVSAQKMQKVQPHMKAIQEKFKKLKPTDPKRQQMNTEVMALYKEHGVNPLGGCLPLLLQMPFFLAFYNLLSVSIELRQAPFILWIKDLSAYDHTFILPVLMTISMVAAQKMTPSPSADPIQAKMMLAMPLVFGFMLAFTSSGLVLYWLTSNLVGVGQQYFMNKFGPTAVPPHTKRIRQGKRKEN
jgi:YidC/Oxa1 family membrane protein insertase